MSETDLNRHTPLTDAEFHIMLVLTNGENHGYAIMKAIEDHPEIEFSLGPATLYRSIHRMLEKGLVKEVEDRPDPESDDERRRYYRLTGAGRSILAEEAQRLRRLVSLARSWNVIPFHG